MRHFALALLALMLGVPPQAGAQEPSPVDEEVSPWVSGISLGVPREGGNWFGELLTVGLHASHARPGGVGADFYIGTVPRVLFDGGIVPLAGRAGANLPLQMGPDLLLLPGAGVSALGGASSGGAGFGVGLYGGGAVLVLPQGRPGFRTGITWHYFVGLTEPIVLVEFGVLLHRGGT